MKEKNDFSSSKVSFKELEEKYFELKEEIVELKKERDKLLDREVCSTELSLFDKIYLIELLEHEKNRKERNLEEIENLICKFYNIFSDLRDYVDINEMIYEKERRIRNILFQEINFDVKCIDETEYSEFCNHQFVLVDNNLKCIKCGFSTENYNLTEQDLEILIEASKMQGIFFTDVLKDDLLLLAILKDEREKYKSHRLTVLDFEENFEMNKADYIEELSYEDDHELFDINLEVRRAHMLDKGILKDGNTRVSNSKYLDDKKTKDLFDKLFDDYSKIENSNTRFKSMLLEQVKVAKYEILILSGERIPKLVDSCPDEDSLYALAKAVYNLSTSERRSNSCYFETENDSVFYDCRTANQKVNKKIIEMKGIKFISI